MIPSIQIIVDYVLDKKNLSTPMNELIQQIVSRHQWRDVRSACGFLLQWLQINLVRGRPEAMEVFPRFADVYKDLTEIFDDFAVLFQISGSTLDYRSDVTLEQRRQVEEFVRQHYQPITVE